MLTRLLDKIYSGGMGGGKIHSEVSGLAHFVYENEELCLNKVRELISLLPDNNLSGVPTNNNNDSINRLIDELNTFDSDADVRLIISKIADSGYFLEVQKDYASNVVIGFVRFNGLTTGVIANQPSINEGRVDSAAAGKAARFIRFCDSFNIPILTLTNSAGFIIDVQEEHNGLIRHAAKLIYAFSEATVPKLM